MSGRIEPKNRLKIINDGPRENYRGHGFEDCSLYFTTKFLAYYNKEGFLNGCITQRKKRLSDGDAQIIPIQY